MQTKIFVLFFALFVLSGCGYQGLREEFVKSNPQFTVIDKTLFGQDVSSTPMPSTMLEDHSRQEFLELREKSMVAISAQGVAYDFDKEESKKLRLLANGPELSQKLSQSVSLDLLLCVAYERNPQLKNIKQKWLAALQRYSQSEFLMNLLQQYTSFTQSLDLKVDNAFQSPMISEKVPFPKALALNGKVITTEVAMAKVEYNMAVRDLITQLTENYWDVLYLSQAIAIYQEQLQLLTLLESNAKDSLQTGTQNYSEILTIKTTKVSVEAELETHRKELEAAKIKILAALNLPLDTKLENFQKLDCEWHNTTVSDLRSLAKQKRLEIQMVQLQQRKLGEMINMSKAELYPNLTPGLSYLENDPEMEKMDFAEKPSGQPNFSFAQKESYLREMRLEKVALQQEEENIQQQTLAQVQELYVSLDTAWRLLELSKNKLIPLAQENLTVTQTAYKVAKDVNYADMINTARMLLDARLDVEKNKRDYGQKLAELEQLIGQRLKPSSLRP